MSGSDCECQWIIQTESEDRESWWAIPAQIASYIVEASTFDGRAGIILLRYHDKVTFQLTATIVPDGALDIMNAISWIQD